ncbi:unnamed protein product [Haemonchus placei]|uniref:Uncharacterized protein n=1 Tax=Haemonchus placei TaxID=6290 RepID=A0A158QKK3_HAEPC|nr:unnamed protein product [Haemonchus placei]
MKAANGKNLTHSIDDTVHGIETVPLKKEKEMWIGGSVFINAPPKGLGRDATASTDCLPPASPLALPRLARQLAGSLVGTPARRRTMKAAIQVDPVQLKMREQRLRWYERAMKRSPNHPIKEAMEFEAQGKRPRGVPKKRWRDVINMDLAEAEVTAEDAVNRTKWRPLQE